jgi:hypothetical protein
VQASRDGEPAENGDARASQLPGTEQHLRDGLHWGDSSERGSVSASPSDSSTRESCLQVISVAT